MEKKTPDFTKIESEIFALVKSIQNLSIKYKEGIIDKNFVRKAMNNAYKGLLKVTLYFKKKNISLEKFLENMNFIDDYNNALEIFENFSKLHFSNGNNQSKIEDVEIMTETGKTSFFELPGIASKVTSTFITLMDALKLEGQDLYLIVKLLKELRTNLKNFPYPGLEEIRNKIKKIQKKVSNNTENLMKDNQFRNSIVDELYQIFKNFQKKLNVKN